MKYALVGSLALVCAAALAGCNANGSLNISTTTDINTTLGIMCPTVATIQNSTLSLNANDKAALATLAAVCPPNPPPTTVVTATVDMINAYIAIEPLLAQIK
jgi:hypothetical protein